MIRWAETEPLYQKNEEACRDGVPLLREGSGGGMNGILLISHWE
jgi:hypothetical protein